jgi:glycosyltransferase involved in cell wall biosynthesis
MAHPAMTMLILVANHALKDFGGTESYVYALIEELRKNPSFRVEYFTFHQGKVSALIEQELQVGFMSLPKYDLILANHNTCVRALFDKGITVQTCHGIYPKIEQPSIYADTHIAISEEVQKHLKAKGYSSTIIRNGINMFRFQNETPVHSELKNVLSLCQSEAANAIISSACLTLQLHLVTLNKYENGIWDVPSKINEADIVIGLGRSAYEAMACGRPVIVFDIRSYNGNKAEGYVLPEKASSYLKTNFSGRQNALAFEKEDLIKEMKKYNHLHGKTLNVFVSKYLGIEEKTKEYLSIDKKKIHWRTKLLPLCIQIIALFDKRLIRMILKFKDLLNKVSKG